MKKSVTFYFVVRYKAPSKEKLFLGGGWGLRDVRGPYLDGLVGHIFITNTILSPEIPSTVSLVLSASNRCPTPSILAKVSTAKAEVSKKVVRNGSTDFVLDSVYAGPTNDLEIVVQLPDVKTDVELNSFWTILAIDELNIERF